MPRTLEAEDPEVVPSDLTLEMANNLVVGASAVKSISSHQIMDSLKPSLAKTSTQGDLTANTIQCSQGTEKRRWVNTKENY